jgi:hypothetical protein
MMGPSRPGFPKKGGLETVAEHGVELGNSGEKRELNRSVFLKPRLSIRRANGPLWINVIFSDTDDALSNCLKNGT